MGAAPRRLADMRTSLWALALVGPLLVALAALADGLAPRIIETRCSVCGKVAARIEIQGPAGARKMVYRGIMAGSGPSGVPVSAARETAIAEAFGPPVQPGKIKAAQLHDDGGFCDKCQAFYCFTHWNTTTTGGGWCPKRHLKILDPHGGD
jgi:hypothetical protein